MRVDIAAAFAAPPPLLDFVLPGLVAGTVGTLFSPGATGKSFLLIEACAGLACAVAGGDVLGLADGLPKKRALYVALEDPAQVLAQRLHALGQHLRPAARDALAEALHVECLVGEQFDVMSAAGVDRLLQLADGSRLVVLDTIRRCHRLDENSAGDMAALLAQLEHVAARTGAAIVFAQHVAKAAQREGQGDQQHAARGSSVLTDNARWGAALVRMTHAEAEKTGIAEKDRPLFVRFSVPKNNFSEPLPDRWFKRCAGGVLVPDPGVAQRLASAPKRAANSNSYAAAKNGYLAAVATEGGDDEEW